MEPDPKARDPRTATVVALAMERAGWRNAGDVVDALGMSSASSGGAAAKVRKWIRGIHGPRFAEAMDMLSKAGLLAPEADAAWRGSIAVDQPEPLSSNGEEDVDESARREKGESGSRGSRAPR